MSYVLTLVAARAATSLSPGLIAAVRDAAGGGGPPDILAEHEAVDIPLAAAPDIAAVRAAIGAAPVDAIAQPAAGRRKALLVADMDGTIVRNETLDDLARFAGVGAEVAAITARSMAGAVDFADALRARVALLRGLGLDALERAWAGVELTDGARALVGTMRAHGATTALVSGGFTWFTARVATVAGFDVHHANVLLDDGAVLLGTVAEPVLDRAAKAGVLRALAAERTLPASATLAVGDGANDLDMLREAGLGVAFHARPVVANAAAAQVAHADLRALLYAQGYRASEFVA